MCKIEACKEPTWCFGWCHMHFLALFSVSSKKARWQ